MLLPLQVGCSKLASKALPFLLHYKLPETRCKKTQALMGATRPEAAEKCPDGDASPPLERKALAQQSFTWLQICFLVCNFDRKRKH